jgi:hypothetical protein
MASCSAACAKRVSNLGSEGQDKALRMGVILFTLTLIAAVAMVKAGVAAPYRIALIIPFMIAANGAFMGLFKA